MPANYRIVSANNSAQQPRKLRSRVHYPYRVMGGLGIVQLFLGVIAVCMQIVAFCTLEPTSYLGAGIWGGLFFLLSGILALLSAKRETNISWAIAVMVVSIFAILVALGILAVASIGIHLTSNYRYDTDYPLSWKTLESLLVVISLVEALVAFLTSLMACKGIYISCQSPKQESQKSDVPIYVYFPKESSEVPEPVEMRSLVNGTTVIPMNGYHEEYPSDPAARGNFTASDIVFEHDDFEPPPAYSEVHNH
ncbi:hypothetical protein CHUAL_013788 [Chamberlinius hualienensis]